MQNPLCLLTLIWVPSSYINTSFRLPAFSVTLDRSSYGATKQKDVRDCWIFLLVKKWHYKDNLYTYSNQTLFTWNKKCKRLMLQGIKFLLYARMRVCVCVFWLSHSWCAADKKCCIFSGVFKHTSGKKKKFLNFLLQQFLSGQNLSEKMSCGSVVFIYLFICFFLHLQQWFVYSGKRGGELQDRQQWQFL